MKKLLFFTSFFIIGVLHGQKEFANIDDESKSDLREYIKQNNPTIFLLDGKISETNLANAEVIYTDFQSLDLISRIDIQKFNGNTIIIRVKSAANILEKIVNLINEYPNKVNHVHIIIERPCSSPECFSFDEKNNTLREVTQQNLLITYEEEKLQ